MTEKEEIEQLKKRVEILERRSKENSKANIWKEVKEKFSKEFDKFKWIDRWSYTDANNRVITHNAEINNKHEVESVIGTLIRCALHKRRIALLENKEKEKAENITKSILEILIKEGETNEKKTR